MAWKRQLHQQTVNAVVFIEVSDEITEMTGRCFGRQLMGKLLDPALAAIPDLHPDV
jgi:hypothetical protein